MFEEHNPTWGLVFRSSWSPSPALGWVRRTELVDLSGTARTFDVIDGLVDVMPAGVDARTEQLTSNLVDAYKRSETGRWGTSAFFTLESLITDRAEPAEALVATMIWSSGFDSAVVDLDERTMSAFPGVREPTGLLTGRRGSYLLRGAVALEAGASASWMIVADTDVDRPEVERRLALLESSDLSRIIDEDVRAGSERLAGMLAAADADQHSGDAVADAHHLSNVMFNTMRGGALPHVYEVPARDLQGFVVRWNRDVAARHPEFLEAVGEHPTLRDVLAAADETSDPDLVRLVLEYLPLAFARRHGDPSRPWNRFSIRIRDESGAELLAYEGNWRDIFQNWEALLLSAPHYSPNVVAKFVNASTLDGHNPYRISDRGVDWEVPEPDDPWSNIGYWGDHQIVYLLRLLEAWQRVEPDGLSNWLQEPSFVYADIPYALADYEQMVEDPRNTITFDTERETDVEERVRRLGADGRLVVAPDGGIAHVTLIEKLLVPALAKMTAFVPTGGIWMNTQRPEWNDANNALAGFGLSMVTLQYLYRYVGFIAQTLPESGTASMTIEVADWLRGLVTGLGEFDDLSETANPVGRRAFMDRLGAIGTDYRNRVRHGVSGERTEVEATTMRRFCELARQHLRATIDAGRRDDGLFDSYNLISFPDDHRAEVKRLGPMLEGQVAAIASGLLSPSEVIATVDHLYDSDLYRPDQDSFLLYPRKQLDAFLDRNVLDADILETHPFLQDLVGDESGALLRQGPSGSVHFNPKLVNAEAVREAAEHIELSHRDRDVLVDIYDEHFGHHAFTGRSGSMYGYEGLGSIYWHMVAKLLLAVQEQYQAATDHGASAEEIRALAQRYLRIRDGLGFRKDPQTYGAIPTDCYSHTTAHAGAQQPGMTGQVKEEVITRIGELGVRFKQGQVTVSDPLLPPAELFDGGSASITVCGVLVELIHGDEAAIEVTTADGESVRRPGDRLTEDESSEVFGRTGSIRSIAFTLPTDRE